MHLVVVLLALALTACAAQVDAPAADGAQVAVVSRHVDGDTLWVRAAGEGPLPRGEHKVRLLEIDTPEVGGHGQREECFGPEASAFIQKEMPAGSTVTLRADREDADRYGRYLRYVWTDDGTFFNDEAVRQGYARAVLYEPNDAYIDQLRAAEREARAARRGMWAACPVGR